MTLVKMKINNYFTDLRGGILLVLIVCASVCVGCAGSPLLKTNNIKFRCDSAFNDGLRLPVDLVYVPQGESVDTVTQVSPDEWFDSEARAQWQLKQSLSLRETGERNDVEVKLNKPAQTAALVIIVDYADIKVAETQIIVLDVGAKENEDIFVTVDGILHRTQ